MSERFIQETGRLYPNKKLKVVERPFCKCGCGQRVEITRRSTATLRRECGRRLALERSNQLKNRLKAIHKKQKERVKNESNKSTNNSKIEASAEIIPGKAQVGH